MKNLIKCTWRKLFWWKNIDLMQLLDNAVKSQIAFALAARYDAQQLQNLQLKIDVNTPSNQVRFVGSPLNPIYPEILIWRPDYPGADKGKTALVEVIETSRSLQNNNLLNKLTFLSSLISTGVIFNLVIPSGEAPMVRTMLTQNNIVVTNLIGYTFNNGIYNFTIV